MKLSEVFALAKAELASYSERHTSPFICWRLSALVRAKTIHVKDWNLATAVIRERLDGHISLESWLYAHFGLELWSQARALPDYKERRVETRMRWLDSLIAEFRAEGD